MNSQIAFMSTSDLKDALAEAEALAQAIADVSADGRRMANELAATITDLANLQCDALDARASTLLRRVAELRNQIAA